MDEAQQSLVAAVKPNIAYPDIHMLAHRRVAELLVRFQFVRDLDAEAIVDKRISSAFLPHGVGHYLGLQVHDVGGFLADPTGNTIPKPEGHPYLRLTRKIEPRMVFTIEPGFYFIESLLADLRKSDDAKYVDWSTRDLFRIRDSIAAALRIFSRKAADHRADVNTLAERRFIDDVREPGEETLARRVRERTPIFDFMRSRRLPDEHHARAGHGIRHRLAEDIRAGAARVERLEMSIPCHRERERRK